MRHKLLLLWLLLFISGVADAQVTIRGRVIDSSDSQPVIGATVRVVGNKKSAVVTNIDGQFSIEVPDMQAEVEAIFIGFPNKRMKVQQDMLIVLDDESVVVPHRKRLRIELTDGEDSILHGINDFSFRLLRAVNKQKNMVLSPLSITCLLSMTNNSAAGQTQSEVCQLLDCQPETANAFYKKLIPYLTGNGEGSCFSMANALFVNPKWPLKDDFRREAVEDYQAWISNDLNVKSVNDWCASQTRRPQHVAHRLERRLLREPMERRLRCWRNPPNRLHAGKWNESQVAADAPEASFQLWRGGWLLDAGHALHGWLQHGGAAAR